MALTETRPDSAVTTAIVDAGGIPPRTAPTGAERLLGTGDSKVIGRIFIGASLLFIACDLVLAALANLQIASGDLIDETVAYRFGLSHPLMLFFCGVLPLVLGLATFLVPRQLGADTVSFPRASALSLWGWLFGTVLYTIALLAKGSYGGSSLEMVRMGHVALGLIALSLLVGIVSVMTTIMSARPAGLSLDRVPFFSFSMLVTGALWLVTIPALFAQIVLWHIRRPSVIDLTEAAYPALSWIFQQPALYIAAIPVLGLLADSAAAASGARQKNYSVVQGLLVAFGALSFGTWAQSELAGETIVGIAFALLIALPVLGVLGASLDTLRRGKVAMSGGLVGAIFAALILLLAIVAGAVHALSSAGDGNLFDVTAGSFHTQTPGLMIGQFYLVIGAVVTAGIAAVFQWGSRLAPAGLPAGAGLALAPLAAVGGLVFGLGNALAGITNSDDVDMFAMLSGVGAIVLAVAALGAFAAFVGSLAGKGSGSTGASGGTLEWLDAAELPAIESEYPVLDMNEKGAN